MTLSNKYFFMSTEDHYNHGKVLEDVGHGFFLLHFTGTKMTFKSVYHMGQMLNNDELNFFHFFDTEEELDEYVKWIETPIENNKEKVVKLVKDT
jgi:hypothetical protein